MQNFKILHHQEFCSESSLSVSINLEGKKPICVCACVSPPREECTCCPQRTKHVHVFSDSNCTNTHSLCVKTLDCMCINKRNVCSLTLVPMMKWFTLISERKFHNMSHENDVHVCVVVVDEGTLLCLTQAAPLNNCLLMRMLSRPPPHFSETGGYLEKTEV